jgi:2,4-dienoyl-CoA reductase-like NADH-dependent reductase (Old Yellow Enzyme family)
VHPPYPHLQSSIRLGPKTLRHRAYMSGHSMGHNSSEGFTARGRAYLVARAAGGAAMVGVESAAVHVSSIDDKVGALPLYSDVIIPSMAETADAVHRAGSHLMMILQHRGQHVSALAHRAPPLAPSPIVDVWTGDIARALSKPEIREIVASFAAAARRCRAAGVDVIEVMGGLDYLIGSFLSPALNQRTDEYGGSTANRARFLVEVLDGVREATRGELAVGLRISVCGVVREDDDVAIERSIETLRLLEERRLVDYFSLTKGSYRDMHAAIPSMLFPRATNAELGRRVRSQISSPISFAGRIRTAQEAESMLSSGCVDLIAMARTWIAEPDWMSKVEQGAEEQIRPCISCNQACMGFAVRVLPGSCVVNPGAGRESEHGELSRAAARLRIAVVGAGPAGLESARVAAFRGHQVSVYEAGNEVGGSLLLAAKDRDRNEIALAVQWWSAELSRLGVEVRLSSRVEHGADLGADRVIWAVGARPSQAAVGRYRPELLKGIPGASQLLHGRDALRDGNRASGSVLVIDEEGGWPVVTIADRLMHQPGVSSVTVITAERAMLGENHTQYTLEGPLVAARVAQAGIAVHLQTMAAEVMADGRIKTLDGCVLGPFNSVILSTGTSAEPAPQGVIPIGDCLSPRGIWSAVSDGYAAGASV